MKAGGWGKSPPELVEAFSAAVAEMPGAEPRKMFGYPAAFANGYLFTGLFEDRWFVRLGGDDLAELERLGGSPFEPMAGRAMRGYLVLPHQIQDDAAALRPWLDRALAHVAQMPPKEKKPSRR